MQPDKGNLLGNRREEREEGGREEGVTELEHNRIGPDRPHLIWG